MVVRKKARTNYIKWWIYIKNECRIAYKWWWMCEVKGFMMMTMMMMWANFHFTRIGFIGSFILFSSTFMRSPTKKEVEWQDLGMILRINTSHAILCKVIQEGNENLCVGLQNLAPLHYQQHLYLASFWGSCHRWKVSRLFFGPIHYFLALCLCLTDWILNTGDTLISLCVFCVMLHVLGSIVWRWRRRRRLSRWSHPIHWDRIITPCKMTTSGGSAFASVFGSVWASERFCLQTL